MPNCGVGSFLDVVQIVEEVIQKYSNLTVEGYLSMIVLGMRQDWRGNYGGKVLVKIDLKMVLMEVKLFLVEMIFSNLF